jgi:hypothetical protein
MRRLALFLLISPFLTSCGGVQPKEAKVTIPLPADKSSVEPSVARLLNQTSSELRNSMDDPQKWLVHGSALFANAYYHESAESLRQAITLKSEMPQATYLLAAALRKANKQEDGIVALQAALVLIPEYDMEAGMGATSVDIDQDGDRDVYITNIYGESDSFYRNEGDFFQDMTRRTGLAAETRAYTRWGVVFADLDNDTRLDLYETTGGVATGATLHSLDDPLAEPNLLFQQIENGRFELVRPRGGTNQILISSSHGVASGDIDGDGGVDLVVVNSNTPLNILRNVVPNRGNWISFHVLNAHGSDAIGARVELTLDDGSQLFAEVHTTSGYASAQDPRRHFGLGSKTVEMLRIHWLDGSIRVVENPELNIIHTIKYAE